jgi:hypothetical protein
VRTSRESARSEGGLLARLGALLQTGMAASGETIGYRESGAADALVELEVREPVPRPRDLVVAVKAVSVNPADCKVRAFEASGG